MTKISSAKKLFYISINLLLIASLFVAQSLFIINPKEPEYPTLLVGIDAAYATVDEIKQIIDEVKAYTNFFVVGSTAITWDLAKLSEVCQYLYDNEMYFLTFAHSAANQFFSQIQWVEEAKQKYGTMFLGLYAYDEPGGHQIDHDYMFMCAQEALDYADAASKYVQNLTYYLNEIKLGWELGNLPLYTSDYALHEFTYRAGYDVVFTEFGWNNNRQLSVSLGRGAATAHQKEWGVMITGSINDTIVESGQEMYKDMLVAYENGAKYIVVFDYPTLHNGILELEHFNALKQFWEYTKTNPRPIGHLDSDRVAYVVPKNYGFGFRGPTDKIWGLWEADGLSEQVWNQVNDLLKEHGKGLDVIYEDCLGLNLSEYRKLIFWNGTIITQ